MKIAKKEINALLYIIGVALAAGGIFWGSSLSTKKDTLELENATLTSEVAYLQDLMNHKQEYLDEMDRMNLEMDEIKNQFPSDIYPENQIMYANGLEAQFDVLLDTLDMPGIVGVQVETQQPASAGATDPAATNTATTNVTATNSSILLSKASTTVAYQASYGGLKKLIKYLNEDKERKSVESLTVGYDTETGNLQGSLVFNMYALSGTGKEYVPPVVTGVTDGKNAIFTGATVLNRNTANKAGDAATADGIADNADEKAEETETEE